MARNDIRELEWFANYVAAFRRRHYASQCTPGPFMIRDEHCTWVAAITLVAMSMDSTEVDLLHEYAHIIAVQRARLSSAI